MPWALFFIVALLAAIYYQVLKIVAYIEKLETQKELDRILGDTEP